MLGCQQSLTLRIWTVFWWLSNTKGLLTHCFRELACSILAMGFVDFVRPGSRKNNIGFYLPIALAKAETSGLRVIKWLSHRSIIYFPFTDTPNQIHMNAWYQWYSFTSWWYPMKSPNIIELWYLLAKRSRDSLRNDESRCLAVLCRPEMTLWDNQMVVLPWFFHHHESVTIIDLCDVYIYICVYIYIYIFDYLIYGDFSCIW